MAMIAVDDLLGLLPALQHAPSGEMWVALDREADVLYITFSKPSCADDAELTEDGVIVRYDSSGAVIGYTILNASLRGRAA